MGVIDSTDNQLRLRLAALFHDVGKSITQTITDTGIHFYHHDIEGAKITRAAMERLKFSSDLTEEVAKLVTYHTFAFYEVKPKNRPAVMRRLIAKLDKDWSLIREIIALRYADKCKKARGPGFNDYDIIDINTVVNEIRINDDAILLNELLIDGDDIMKICNIPQGEIVGIILDRLHRSVLSNSELNDFDLLSKMALAEHKNIALQGH